MEKIINDLTNEDLDILSEFDQGDNELETTKQEEESREKDDESIKPASPTQNP